MNAAFTIIPCKIGKDKICTPVNIESGIICNSTDIFDKNYTRINEFLNKRKFRQLVEQSKYSKLKSVELRGEKDAIPAVIVYSSYFRSIIGSGSKTELLQLTLNKTQGISDIGFIILIPRNILHLI